MKKKIWKNLLLVALMVVLCVAIGMTASALDAKGRCGDKAYYTYNPDTKTVTITGCGKIGNSNHCEWPSPFADKTDVEVVIIDNGITSIGSSVFRNCTSLTNITIPDSVINIEGGAFKGCTSLTNITIPDSVISIGGYAFDNCTNLTSATLSNNLTSIEYDVFRYCTSLTSIIIPEGVTSIGQGVFYGCTNLTSIKIPDSVTSIGFNAFGETNYYNNKSNWENKCLYIGNHLIRAETDISECTIKNGTKSISSNAFNSCTNLTSIIIPDSITNIGSSVFSNCTSLTNITIPDSVINIEWGAFKGCTSLTNITIPSSVTSIGRDAFGGTGYYNNQSNWKDKCLYIGDCLVNVEKDISKCDIKEGTRIISSDTFSGCTSLTNISIPDSIINIGDGTFSGCTSLTNISIPDSVISIGYGAFHSCESLTSIIIPDSVINLGDAFYGCKNLTSISISDSVTSICYGAFKDCDKLSYIKLPKNLKTIEDEAFFFCFSLETIELSDENKYFSLDENGVLYNKDKTKLVCYPAAKKRKTFTIPDSVKVIGNSAFCGNATLEEIIIPDSVIEIEESAFELCLSLKKLVLPGSIKYVSSYFENIMFGLQTLIISDGVERIDEMYIYKTLMLNDVYIESMDVEIIEEDDYDMLGITVPEENQIKYFEFLNRTFWEQNLNGSDILNNEELYNEWFSSLGEEFITKGTTIHCHPGSTAEAYAIKNSDVLNYVLTHFFKGDWTYDYDNMIRYRKCIHCDEIETEALETTGDSDVEIIEPVDPDTDFTVDVVEDYVIIEETISNNITTDFEIVKAFDINLKNKDGVHVQPDGTVKVKLPLDWSKDGVYKVYRVNDNGTLTDMNAYRQGSHMVFDTDHFSIYVIVDESEKADAPTTPDEPQEETKDNFFTRLLDLIKSFFDLIMSWFKK